MTAGRNMTKQERDIIQEYKALCVRSYNLAHELEIPLRGSEPALMTCKELESLLHELDECIQT